MARQRSLVSVLSASPSQRSSKVFVPGAEVGDAVDLCRVADQAVDRPAQRLVRPRSRRHAEGRHDRLLAPEHQADLLADDRVDVADDGLRHRLLSKSDCGIQAELS